jgi:hypothetical protein
LSEAPHLHAAGTIKPGDGEGHARFLALADEAAAVWRSAFSEYGGAKRVGLVVEFPADAMPPGQFKNRSVAWLPTYGMAVGAILAGVCRIEGFGVPPEWILTPPASRWWRGIAPPTKDDPHKERRVVRCETLWNLKPGSLGAKTTAGNVADALLLGFWGWPRMRGSLHGECERVVSFDPSVGCCGWAIMGKR